MDYISQINSAKITLCMWLFWCYRYHRNRTFLQIQFSERFLSSNRKKHRRQIRRLFWSGNLGLPDEPFLLHQDGRGSARLHQQSNYLRTSHYKEFWERTFQIRKGINITGFEKTTAEIIPVTVIVAMILDGSMFTSTIITEIITKFICWEFSPGYVPVKNYRINYLGIFIQQFMAGSCSRNFGPSVIE